MDCMWNELLFFPVYLTMRFGKGAVRQVEGRKMINGCSGRGHEDNWS